MDLYRPNSAEQDYGAGSDQRLRPTPDYDSARLGVGSARRRIPSRGLHLAAMMAGIGLAVVVSSGGGMATVWGKFSHPSARQKSVETISGVPSDRDLDGQKPQRQAEILLERAVGRSQGATDQIEARVDGWRGKLEWDAQLGQLTTAALNSRDREVRDSAVEVQLAAYGLSKSGSMVDALVRQASSPDHARKIWALWGLGLLANRGVETNRVVKVLSAHLKDGQRNDHTAEDSRRWAVEGLALVGTNSTIVPLLEAMRDDPSAAVRERAACSLAESGMFTHEQRMIAVPRLIQLSGDAALDEQTRGWAFQALGDITGQRLPNDSAAWQRWYVKTVASGQ
jgi:hypothetical protein